VIAVPIVDPNTSNPADPAERDNSDSGQTASLNYFNYFTEVEEEFVRRRGKPLMISPIDWALVESWKNAGIPLHVVLRAINQTFDASDARPRNFRKINSVLYCQQEVEACFAEYRLSQVGAHVSNKDDESRVRAKPSRSRPQPVSKEILLDFITRCDEELVVACERAKAKGLPGLSESIDRVRERLTAVVHEITGADRFDPQSIERDFDSMDQLMLEGATGSMKEAAIAELRQQAESQLRPFKKKMDKAMYAQTLENFVMRRIREVNALPRLSLFYL
jgi:hypothetical protein